MNKKLTKSDKEEEQQRRTTIKCPRRSGTIEKQQERWPWRLNSKAPHPNHAVIVEDPRSAGTRRKSTYLKKADQVDPSGTVTTTTSA